jgi:tetratricopeptide (TPR) repeat protein
MLMANREWAALLDLLPPSAGNTAEIEYCRGIALARLGRLQEARRTFQLGREKAPLDKRFYLELAGIAYRQGNSAESRKLLRLGLKLDPKDSYGNDFLATQYFLQGNLEAAVKYWNHAGRPRIQEVRTVPVPNVDPVLLDHSFAFSPASRLTLKELSTTKARLDLMAVFSSYRFELQPRQDGDFDLLFHSVERDGWGSSISVKLLSLLREIPYQTVHLDLFNFSGSGSNLESFYRWDSRKRRAFVSFSSPLKGNPKWRFRLWMDARNENWDIPKDPPAASSVLFKLRSGELGAGVASVIDDRWAWHSGVSISERRLVPSPLGNPGPGELFADGLSLKYETGATRRLIYLPEKRLNVELSAAAQVGRVLRRVPDPYLKMDGGVKWDWFPRARGDDYHLFGSLRAGDILGRPPVVEFYSLGMERDNSLYLRGHPGTLEGMKGTGPLGRGFVLVNSELDKIVHQGGFWKVSVGPLFDFGKTYDRSTGLGSREWLWDAGLQSKVVILRTLTFTFSCGWDLRTGKAALYTGTRSSAYPR